MDRYKDVPLTELTLRRYEKPSNLGRRELVKKLCLSTGLLQPGDSRDVIVDVLFVLLLAAKNNELLSSEEVQKRVIELRKQEGLPLLGIAASNIRRQIKRLRDLYLAEKVKNRYRITEYEPLGVLLQEKLERVMVPSLLSRIKEYAMMVDEKF
ncbi:hypothetical protein DRJ17_03970 [Candidatus Woesearchaeota archaeon]|nr:MAG: hypothetical protein DRJ17_03970 [Candidatus Woesearchaeota archaeon]